MHQGHAHQSKAGSSDEGAYQYADGHFRCDNVPQPHSAALHEAVGAPGPFLAHDEQGKHAAHFHRRENGGNGIGEGPHEGHGCGTVGGHGGEKPAEPQRNQHASQHRGVAQGAAEVASHEGDDDLQGGSMFHSVFSPRGFMATIIMKPVVAVPHIAEREARGLICFAHRLPLC